MYMRAELDLGSTKQISTKVWSGQNANTDQNIEHSGFANIRATPNLNVLKLKLHIALQFLEET